MHDHVPMPVRCAWPNGCSLARGMHMPRRETAKATGRAPSAELDAAADALSRDKKKSVTIKARLTAAMCACVAPTAHSTVRAFPCNPAGEASPYLQGYKAQADLVLAHLDGLLGGCQVR